MKGWITSSNPYLNSILCVVALQMETISSINLIAISGGGSIGPQCYLEMAEQLGASRTLKKPFNQSDLIDAVKELLKG